MTDKDGASAPRITRRRLLTALGAGAVGVGSATSLHSTGSGEVGAATSSTPTPSPTTTEEPADAAARTVVPQVIGHRGAAGLEPPNTLPAVRKALALGVDGIELDVRATRDGTLIAFHDSVLDRKTTGTGLVSQIAYEDLDNVRVNGEAPIPTVEQALRELQSEPVSVMLELKAPQLTRRVLSLVNDLGLLDRTTLVSFDVPYLTPAHGAPVNRGLLGKLPMEGVTETAIQQGYEFAIPHYVPGEMADFTAATWGTGVEPGIWSLVATESGIQESLQARPAFLVTNRPDIALDVRDDLFENNA